MTEYDDRVTNLLAWIRAKQQEPGGTGAPEGYTEMHTYHVWEVLNALKNEPLPTDEDGDIVTSAAFGHMPLVKITYNTNADNSEWDGTGEQPSTLHGPFKDDDEAQAWMDAYPEDTDIDDMVTITLNGVRP